MSDFQQIITYRNKGKSQEEIANILGISRRSVIRYLKSGMIPVYKRTVPRSDQDLMKDYLSTAEQLIEEQREITLNDLYEYLKSKGYRGSIRTLRRRTADFRKKLKKKEVYFSRQARPGEVMEGDFTEMSLLIGGVQKKIYIWITSLPFSNAYFATPYLNCTFECFAEGSVFAFNEFGGIAQKYRLDNFSPAVSKILSGKDRLVTERFAQFQRHYGFAQDFCNPASGNEKGNVEANNKHFKNKIKSRIGLNNMSFINLETFRDFIWEICREHNEDSLVQEKLRGEDLLPLPDHPFRPFSTQIVRISKYSLFSIGTSGHLYSVPSQYIGLSLEARLYPSSIEVVSPGGDIICSHKRLVGVKGLVSIKVEHVIDGLLKKPGAFRDWKYRDVVFERPSWSRFYSKLMESGKSEKDFLKCISLLKEFGREDVTLAMELAMENEMELESSTLRKIISNDYKNVLSIPEIPVNLDQYDFFIKGDNIHELRAENASGP